jgi:hypothetical protein
VNERKMQKSIHKILKLGQLRLSLPTRDLCGSLNNLVRCDSRGFSTSFKQSVSHSEGKPQHLSRQIWLPWKLESHVTLVTSIHSRTGDDIKVTVASRRHTPGRHQQSKQQQQASQSSRVASPRAEAEAGLEQSS